MVVHLGMRIARFQQPYGLPRRQAVAQADDGKIVRQRRAHTAPRHCTPPSDQGPPRFPAPALAAQLVRQAPPCRKCRCRPSRPWPRSCPRAPVRAPARSALPPASWAFHKTPCPDSAPSQGQHKLRSRRWRRRCKRAVGADRHVLIAAGADAHNKYLTQSLPPNARRNGDGDAAADGFRNQKPLCAQHRRALADAAHACDGCDEAGIRKASRHGGKRLRAVKLRRQTKRSAGCQKPRFVCFQVNRIDARDSAQVERMMRRKHRRDGGFNRFLCSAPAAADADTQYSRREAQRLRQRVLLCSIRSQFPACPAVFSTIPPDNADA